MEFLITILLMLVPLIFKGIEKGLTKAAPQQSASSGMEDGDVSDEDADVADEDDVFPRIELPTKVDLPGDDSDGLFVDKVKVEYIPVSKLTEIQPVTQMKKGEAVKNDVVNDIRDDDIQNSNKKEKIDAKKLIIYSEIMKPKY